MGKIIAVWSDVKKTGKSVTAYMLANRIKEMAGDNFKVLVCCLNLKYSSLYRLFGVSESEPGIEDLLNYRFLKYDSRTIISEIAAVNRGIYFIGSYRTTNSYINRNITNYSELIDGFQENFDLTIFDTISGNENLLTNLVLRRADIIVKLFVQDNESLRGLTEQEDPKMQSNQEIIYIASKYRNIYPRLSDIKRRHELKCVYTMNYCEILQEMKNRNSMHLYIQRETSCNNTIMELAKHMLETLCFISEKKFVGEKPGRYVRSLINVFQRQ